MSGKNRFEEYAALAIENQRSISAEQRFQLVNAVGNLRVKRVLDVGCGAGYDLLPFLEKKNCCGFGVDIAEDLGRVGLKFFEATGYLDRVSFIRSDSMSLPFPDESFDVVLCMVALPYMNNEKTIKEIARILGREGILFLQIHSPWFYFAMIRERLLKKQFKALIYPLIALFSGVFYRFTGKQIEGGILKGKEMFQTESMIRQELNKNGLRIAGSLPCHNKKTPAFMVTKQ